MPCCTRTSKCWILSVVSLYLIWDIWGIIIGSIYTDYISNPDSWKGDTDLTKKEAREEILLKAISFLLYLGFDFVFSILPFLAEYYRHRLLYKIFAVYATATLVFGAFEAASCLLSPYLQIWSLVFIPIIMSLGKILLLLLIAVRLSEMKLETFGNSLYPARSSMDDYLTDTNTVG